MAGHSRRVALAALRLGAALKVSPEKLRALAQGAILHDIGKLEVPGDVLNIKGKLNDKQYQIVQKHVGHGYEMCKQLGFLSDELSIIRYHHKRVDGSGYPEGLIGEDIPALARILAVVDVYDALTSDRAYRPAWSQVDAIQHLQKNRGTLFDTNCVDTWVELVVADKQPI
jgi:putative nucleotidyltransferase with HDIG domain